MSELIADEDERGYPAEFLLSRIGNRKIRYRSLVAGEPPENVRHCLLKEYKWVYLQMDKQTREIFAPFFGFSEIRTITSCLRHKAAGGSVAGEALKFSLLSERIKKALAGDIEAYPAVGIIGKALLPVSPEFRRLKAVFAKGGMKAVEQRLAEIYLEAMAGKRLHPAVRFFFIYAIDARNIISLYKHLRWKIEAYPSFVGGGRISKNELKRIFEAGDIRGAAMLIHRLHRTGIQDAAPADVEKLLLNGATESLKRIARDPLSPAVILEYLWYCYIETLKKGLTLFSGGIGAHGNAEELTA